MEEQKEKKSSGKGKTRGFTCVVYPDSAPDNWRDELTKTFIQVFISPLHDKDLNECTNELKKPHYHVIIYFDGPSTVENAHQIFDMINGVYPPETNKSTCKVRSLRGACRYLCHLDNPDKYRYSEEDVTCINGADYMSMIGLQSDKYEALCQMEEFCEQYNVLSFYALARYASRHRQDWSRILKDCGTVYMKEYLQSRKWSVDTGNLHIIDPETGEELI